MPEMPQGDPYIENILEKVPKDVARTLSRDQWDGFRSALRATNASARHMVDLRFILPLYFTRIYCIIIFGRDGRQRVEHILLERRRRAGIAIGAAVLAALLVFFTAVTLMVLYIVKSAANMDLIPDFHLTEWWNR